MKTPIQPVLLDKLKNLDQERKILETPIESRLHYILCQVAEACDFDFDSWNRIGSLYNCVGKSTINMKVINLDGKTIGSSYCPYVIVKGKTYCIRNALPKHWLYEKFEQELILGVKEYRNKQNRLMQSAKSKLTRAEKNILGL